MPTENRSSNTEMVSVPRYMAEEISAALISHGHVALPRGLQQAMNARAEQHQGEPVALPVRLDCPYLHAGYPGGWNACLDEIAKLGPLYTHPAPAAQQEPVAWLYSRPEGQVDPVVTLNKATASDRGSWDETPLYAHAAPGEVERLREELVSANADKDAYAQNAIDLRASLSRARKAHGESQGLLQDQIDTLRAQLAEAQALLRKVEGYHWAKVEPEERARTRAELRDFMYASAEPSECRKCGSLTADACKTGGCWFELEPSAPVERDEQAKFKAHFADYLSGANKLGTDYNNLVARGMEIGWMARAGVPGKPSQP